MLPPRSSLLLAALLHATQVSVATYIDLLPRSGPLHKRNSTSALVYTSGGYNINVTLGGIPYSVMVDTGSSDLWVAGAVPHATTTGATGTVQYAIGSDSGPIETAEMEILGFTIPSQAFIQVASGGTSPDGTGLIGFGPNTGSRIRTALNNTSTGDSPLDNIFRQNQTTPNYVTFLLNRQNDTKTYPGAMTISEVIPQYSNVTNQPKVPVSVLQSINSNDQHWSVFLDKNGIIGPDGKAIQLTSNATDAPTHDATQMVAIFDTGFTLPQVPSAVASAMYSGAKGASLQNMASFGGDIWVIDCGAEVNVSFSIGGQLYPVHPLDTNWIGVDDSGNPICYGPFQPIISGAMDTTIDMILGMAFLTNAYMLLDYGDFVDATTSNTAAPYVQLLSTVDPATAHNEFVAARLNGSDTSGSQHKPGSGSGSGNNNNGTVGGTKGFFEKYKIPIIAGAAGAVVLLLLTSAFVQFRSRKPTYRPLFEPAPAGSMPMNTVSGYNTGGYNTGVQSSADYYNGGAPAPYSDPWGRRS